MEKPKGNGRKMENKMEIPGIEPFFSSSFLRFPSLIIHILLALLALGAASSILSVSLQSVQRYLLACDKPTKSEHRLFACPCNDKTKITWTSIYVEYY